MTGAAVQDFASLVDELALQLVTHSPTFESFVAAMPGVLPDEALAALRRLKVPDAQRLADDAVTDRAGHFIDQGGLLPLPHPLDSEFRFDAATAAILAKALIEATSPGDEILLIGVPSIAVELAAMDTNRVVRFLGPDNSVTASVQSAFKHRPLRLDQGPGATAAAALLDPPWYSEPMAELIRVCAGGCRKGALVTLVAPPIGTRPDIALDRSHFMRVAAETGLTATGAEGPVCYRTPLFELATLERQGIARLPSWRRGEAIEFRMSRVPDACAWTAPRVTELTVAGVRLRLVPGDGGCSSALVPIDAQEVFPSVSARAPGRSRATLWTTTNRAFEVDVESAREALARLAHDPELLHLGLNPKRNESFALQRVAAESQLIHQLTELVGREVEDARRLVGDGAWLRAATDWRS